MNPHSPEARRADEEWEEVCEAAYIELPYAIERHYAQFVQDVLDTAREAAGVDYLPVDPDTVCCEYDVRTALLDWLKARP